MYTRKMYKSFHTSPNYLEFLQMVNQSNSYSYQLTSYQKKPCICGRLPLYLQDKMASTEV